MKKLMLLIVTAFLTQPFSREALAANQLFYLAMNNGQEKYYNEMRQEDAVISKEAQSLVHRKITLKGLENRTPDQQAELDNINKELNELLKRKKELHGGKVTSREFDYKSGKN